MAIISIGYINRKLLFTVFGGLFKFICNIILYHSDVKMRDHPCILGVNAGIGLSLSIIPFLYLNKKKKLSFNSDSNTNRKEWLLNNENISYNDKSYRKKKYLYIVFISLLDCAQKYLAFFYTNQFLRNFWIFDSFLLIIFSYFILKTKAYLHQFFSIVIMVIIGIILIVINYYDKDANFMNVFITLIAEILYCLENVVAKRAMEVKFCSPYQICSIIGIIELIIFIILLIIFTNVPMTGSENSKHVDENYIDNFFVYMEKISFSEIMLFILSMFGRLIFLLLLYMLFYY